MESQPHNADRPHPSTSVGFGFIKVLEVRKHNWKTFSPLLKGLIDFTGV